MNKQEIRCELQQISRERGGNSRWQERWMMGGGKETGRMPGGGRRGQQNNSYVSWVRKKWDDKNCCVVIFKAFCVFFSSRASCFFWVFFFCFSNARHFAKPINATGIWIEERQRDKRRRSRTSTRLSASYGERQQRASLEVDVKTGARGGRAVNGETEKEGRKSALKR